MSRREFTARTKERAWDRACGRCEMLTAGLRCDAVLGDGNVEYHHIVEAVLGGDNSLDNCQALCRAHHRIITSTVSIPRAAKMKRQRRGNINAKTRKGPAIPSRAVIHKSKRSVPQIRCADYRPAIAARRFSEDAI